MVHDEDGKNIWDVDLPESEFSGVHLYVPPPPRESSGRGPGHAGKIRLAKNGRLAGTM